MRTLYDSVTAGNIPLYAEMVAGYVDGAYRWSAADWARFPTAVHVRIAVFASTNDGHVLDVEQGNATPSQAPGWVQRRRDAGVDPTVYCSLSWWPTVRAAFVDAGVPEPHWWIAAYPGNGAQLYPGSIAHQYLNPGPVDVSVVADYWPGIDPTPASHPIASTPPVASAPVTPTPVPLHPSQEDDMITLLRWCYTALVGREPSDVELQSWLIGTSGWSALQIIGAFDNSRAEPGSITKAYADYLGRTASSGEVTDWTDRGWSIGQVRAAIANSPEAAARR